MCLEMSYFHCMRNPYLFIPDTEINLRDKLMSWLWSRLLYYYLLEAVVEEVFVEMLNGVSNQKVKINNSLYQEVKTLCLFCILMRNITLKA